MTKAMTPSAEERWFPVLSRTAGTIPGVIPWSLLAPHHRQAMRNHSQTLEHLADRGGLSWCEALAIIEDSDWERRSIKNEREACIKIQALIREATLSYGFTAGEQHGRAAERARLHAPATERANHAISADNHFKNAAQEYERGWADGEAGGKAQNAGGASAIGAAVYAPDNGCVPEER